MSRKELYRSFYQQCYLCTGGWIPMLPFAAKLELGDFGQIQQAKFSPLGNIAKLRLVFTIKSTDTLPLNALDWQLEAGMENHSGSTQTQSQIQADGQENLSAWSTQTLTFKQKGDFVFHGTKPKAKFIANWSEFKQDITLKLTQADYSFREVYVVTALASVSHWGLVIAGAEGAQLELAAQTYETDYFTLLSHQTATALNSRHIAVFDKSTGLPGHFFKAKKLVLSDKKKDQLFNQMLQQSVPPESDEMSNWLNTNLLNRVQANELNPANCLEYFDWVDVSLDDVEKLC